MVSRVLIVGAGMCGMSLGVALKRAGISSEIVEIRPALTEPGTGISLQGPALRAVPTANLTLVTIACESADYRCDEGLVQLALVRSGRPVPVTGGAASRNPGPATPAQCVAA